MPHRMGTPPRLEMQDENADPSGGLQSLRVKAVPSQELVRMLHRHRHTLREVQVSITAPPGDREDRWPKEYADVHTALSGCPLLWSVLLDRGEDDECDSHCSAQVAVLHRRLPGCNIQCTNCGASAP